MCWGMGERLVDQLGSRWSGVAVYRVRTLKGVKAPLIKHGRSNNIIIIIRKEGGPDLLM